MNKSKVRLLKWNLKKLRGSVLHFTHKKKIINLKAKKKKKVLVDLEDRELN